MSNDLDVTWAIAVLAKLPVGDSAQGSQAQVAFKLLRQTVARQEATIAALRRAGYVDLDAELRAIYDAIPQMPITRGNLNYERERAVNLAFDRFLAMYAKHSHRNDTNH